MWRRPPRFGLRRTAFQQVTSVGKTSNEKGPLTCRLYHRVWLACGVGATVVSHGGAAIDRRHNPSAIAVAEHPVIISRAKRTARRSACPRCTAPGAANAGAATVSQRPRRRQRRRAQRPGFRQRRLPADIGPISPSPPTASQRSAEQGPRVAKSMPGAFSPATPTPAVAPSATPVDPTLINEVHLWLAVALALLAGVMVVRIRGWILARQHDPLCICNDPLSRHAIADSGCSDCRCRCFIERPAA